VWKMMLSCLMWYLWKEWNDSNFENQERMPEELELFFFYSLLTKRLYF
jgi:hypothetical protein